MNEKIKRFFGSSKALNLLYLPAILLFIAFIFVPFMKGLMISFTNWDGYSTERNFVALKQYKRMLGDANILTTVKNTLIYGVGSTIFQNLIGLLYALFLDQKLKGTKIVRTIVYLPVIISPLIMGYVWYFFFQYSGGALNDVMMLFNREGIDWLSNGSRAVWLITLVNTYQFLGVAMILYLAGLQGISKDYAEAASIDGATSWQKFRHITLPLLMPAITTSMVMNIIGGFKLFDAIVALTNGGPGYSSHSLSTMMYNLYFTQQDAGYASALGIFMFVLIAVVSITTLVQLRKKEVDF
ncbi:MAG: carbohydrate ABC transporter permease [Cellulosilyticaceae bacterium]